MEMRKILEVMKAEAVGYFGFRRINATLAM